MTPLIAIALIATAVMIIIFMMVLYNMTNDRIEAAEQQISGLHSAQAKSIKDVNAIQIDLISLASHQYVENRLRSLREDLTTPRKKTTRTTKRRKK